MNCYEKNNLAKNKVFLSQMDECKNYSAYGAEWLEDFLLSLMWI